MVDIREIRHAARISQVELSRSAHISRPRLSGAENGYFELSNDELATIQAVIVREPARLAAKIRQAFANQKTSRNRNCQELLTLVPNRAPCQTEEGRGCS